MSAPAIAIRNAANAQHSTGPVTDEGKTRSAQNALRHGLTSNKVVLAHENAEEFESMKQTFFKTHRPATEREAQLVTHMVESWWRLERALRVESEFLQQRAEAISEAHPKLTGDAALAMMFIDPGQSKSYRLFLRYLTNAQNTYRQACAEFEKVRKERLTREREALMAKMMSAGQPKSEKHLVPPTHPSSPVDESGFVSHSSYAVPHSAPAHPEQDRCAA